jgi:hypothetical protein
MSVCRAGGNEQFSRVADNATHSVDRQQVPDEDLEHIFRVVE